MQTNMLTESMHVIVAEHLAGEYATATLALTDGRELLLTGVDRFDKTGPIGGELFGGDSCSFDPADVCGIVLSVLDPLMMAPSEMLDLGLANPVCLRLVSSNT